MCFEVVAPVSVGRKAIGNPVNLTNEYGRKMAEQSLEGGASNYVLCISDVIRKVTGLKSKFFQVKIQVYSKKV
ncbi:hypothetical protein D3C77_296630 [compost metagenome]